MDTSPTPLATVCLQMQVLHDNGFSKKSLFFFSLHLSYKQIWLIMNNTLGKCKVHYKQASSLQTHFIQSYTDSGIIVSKTQHRRKWGSPLTRKNSYLRY